MDVNTQVGLGGGLTVTEAARRAQIVKAAIAVIAKSGYSNASFARIVREAGLSSTRMISYHFTDRVELMRAVVATIIETSDDFRSRRENRNDGRAQLLRNYIECEIAFAGEFPDYARALVAVGAHADELNGDMMLDVVWQELATGRLARQLTQGQQEGVFTNFDVDLMAMTIRQAIDGVTKRAAAEPDLDLAACSAELADLFDRATRAS